MTHMISLSANFRTGRAVEAPSAPRRKVGQETFFRRMDRLDERRDYRTVVRSAPQHLDARLLADRQALEDAWRVELEFFIAMKRTRSPAAIAAAAAAQATTGEIVKRIEAVPAKTFDGQRLKARAASWRRYSTPIDVIGDEAGNSAPLAYAL